MRKLILTVCVIASSALLIAGNVLPANAAGSGGTTGPNAAAQTDPISSISVAKVDQAASAVTDASGTVFGGTLSTSVYGTNLTPATLNGTSTQTMTGTSAPWKLVDARGTGVAWNLSVTVSNFTSAAVTNGTTTQPLRTIFGSNLAITPGSFALAADTATGFTLATGAHDYDLGTTAVIATPLAYSNKNPGPVTATLVTGADSSSGVNPGDGAKGAYVFSAPSFALTIPRNAYKSNVDNSTGSPVVQPYVGVITFTMI
jgi:hypothetical protein